MSINSHLLRGWVTALVCVFAFSFMFTTGCKKATPEPMSRLEFLEKDVIEHQEYLEKAELEYKTKRSELVATKDHEGVQLLDACNKDRLVAERKMLKMKQKELEKLRKAEGKAE